jgi:RNA polymerase sigma-70 factor (ECF subfamily)
MRIGDDDGTGSKAAFDRVAFDREVVELIPSLLRLAVRLCGDEHAAEDVVQDALVRAARSWRSFRGEAKLSTWLSSIVVNAFRDWLARQQRDRATETLEGREVEPSSNAKTTNPARSAEADEFGQIVARCVSQLPPRQREVLVLSAYEGLSGREVAGVLEVSEQDVRTNLFYARQKMRELLKPYVGEAMNRAR